MSLCKHIGQLKYLIQTSWATSLTIQGIYSIPYKHQNSWWDKAENYKTNVVSVPVQEVGKGNYRIYAGPKNSEIIKLVEQTVLRRATMVAISQDDPQ